jgi:hypothetical protein
MQGDLFASVEAQAVTTLDGDAQQRQKAKREWRNTTPEERSAMFVRAISEGRYSPEYVTLCSGCRNWVTEILHVDPQQTRVRYCRACAERLHVIAPKREALPDVLELLPENRDADTISDLEYGLPPQG